MIDKIYSSNELSIMYDVVEDLVYIKVKDLFGEAVTRDYTKQELVSILKDMIKVLED